MEHFSRANYNHTQGHYVSIGPVPRSAKRWARSAHLHEAPRRGGSGGRVAANYRGRTNDENYGGKHANNGVSNVNGGDTIKSKTVLNSNGNHHHPSGKGEGYPLKKAEEDDSRAFLAFMSRPQRPAARRLSISGVSDDSSAWVDTDVDDDTFSEAGVADTS
jgi:hypothetical protein